MKKFRRLIAMGLAASFLALFGCAKKEEKFKPVEGAEIMSLSIVESQMDLMQCYSFELREEDGTVYFCAEFMQSDDGIRVTFEDCEVDNADMDELRNIAEENNTVECFKTYKERKIKVFAQDAPFYSSSIIMSDGSSKTITMRCDGSAQLREFFIELAGKYSSEASSENTVSD